MMSKPALVVSVIVGITMTTALEATRLQLQPVPYGNAAVHYSQGHPTIELRGRNGSIEVTPFPIDHGCINFGLTVFNGSDHAADIDLGNVGVLAGDTALPILTANDVEQRIRNHAFWMSMAVAAVSGYAASTTSTTGGHPYHGGYVRARGVAVGAGGLATAIAIQERGLRDAEQAGDEILALTTVDPGNFYGGRVVVAKIKGARPQTIMVRVVWNGEVYVSKWQLVSEGTPTPVFNPVALADTTDVPRTAAGRSQQLPHDSVSLSGAAQLVHAGFLQTPM